MIDAHCHMDRMPDLQKVLSDAVQRDIRIIAVSTDPDSLTRTCEICTHSDRVIPSAGLHPSQARNWFFGGMQRVWQSIQAHTMIGEIGLDRYFLKDSEEYEIQKMAFTSILQICEGTRKILNVHSRSAEKDVLDLLADYHAPLVIMHWYVGPAKLLPVIFERKYFLSIGPAILSSAKVRDYVAQCPPHLLLTESDGPMTYRDGSVGSPSIVPQIVEAVADIWERPVGVVRAQIEENFDNLLSYADTMPSIMPTSAHRSTLVRP